MRGDGGGGEEVERRCEGMVGWEGGDSEWGVGGGGGGEGEEVR